MEVNNEKQEQFLRLYSHISSRLSRFVRSMVWNADDARDIAVETVLIAFEKLEMLRSDVA